MRFKYIKYDPYMMKPDMTAGKAYLVLNSVEAHKMGYFCVINDVGDRVAIRMEW